MTTQQKELYQKCAAALHTGFNWCLACQTICDLENPGEPHQCCAHCGSHRVQWQPPSISGEEEKTLNKLNAWADLDGNRLN